MERDYAAFIVATLSFIVFVWVAAYWIVDTPIPYAFAKGATLVALFVLEVVALFRWVDSS